MANDTELRERWHDYHLISDVLKQQLPEQLNIDLSMKIQDVLIDEPALASTSKGSPVGFIKRFSGLAVAASVAVMGVVVVLNTAVQPNGGDAITLAKSESGISSSQMVAGSSSTNTTIQAVDPRLNKYLVDHSEHAVSASIHGVLPYARIVGQQQVRN